MLMFENMDWAMLRAQKLWLCEHAGNDAAEGLLCLLDNLQDEAVVSGIDEEVVFGKSLAEHAGEPCPYAVEIHNDYTHCYCGEERRRECAQDI